MQEKQDIQLFKVENGQVTGPEPLLWSEFEKVEFPEQRWKIKNLIPHEGFVILASPSGEKKSWLAMEMARCLALGEPYLQNPEFASTQCNVLYIDEEMPKSELQRRGKLLGFQQAGSRIWLLSKNNLNLNTKVTADWLLAFMESNKIEVVIVDTLRAVAGGLNEDKAEDVRKFFDLFKEAKDKGIAVIFLDHCRKPSQHEGREPKKEQLFASQDKLASVEVLLMLKSKEATGEIMVYQKKNRLGMEIAPFMVNMTDSESPSGEKCVTLIYRGGIEDKEEKKEQAKELIQSLLAGGGMTRKELIRRGNQDMRIGSRNTSDALRELEQAGAISVQKQGRENFYTLQESGNDLTEEDIGNLFDSL